MKNIIPTIDHDSRQPLYLQIYEYIRNSILNKSIPGGERLPSLRALSGNLDVSLTTVNLAYNQLEVEGYITSKPQSGYYVNDLATFVTTGPDKDDESKAGADNFDSLFDNTDDSYIHDLSAFDFNKWKKCTTRVINDHSHLLLFEGDPQGELPLRKEISRYVYQSRGVTCSPDQVVIGAGTQQLTSHISRLLNIISINLVAVENPGYIPVRNIFRDNGFAMSLVDVGKEGILIDKLPSNIRSAAYVCPSNQFPTGAVMPIGKRYELLEWANKNDSLIIEDDYDSELRYFGKPVPALQGLDRNHRVIYLGSFSSTLYPAIKISYMILPDEILDIFNGIKSEYTQACSKVEQLTLALFMSKGMYQTGIKKLRNLNAHKLSAAVKTLETEGRNLMRIENNNSGLSLILNIRSDCNPQLLCDIAKEAGVNIVSMASYRESSQTGETPLIFYYNQLPLKSIPTLITSMIRSWEKSIKK